MASLAESVALPAGLRPEDDFIRAGGAFIGVRAFQAQVAGIAAALPPEGAIANLCEDRRYFVESFAAALLRGRTTLLPSSHALPAIDEMRAAHPGSAIVDDARAAARLAAAPEAHGAVPDFIAAIAHTSGSTGKPVAHAKGWASLRHSTALNAATIRAALGEADAGKQPWLVATVPPQHMYGLETSVLLPLLAGFGLYGGRPLLAADVASALAGVPGPRVLVSTPVHLRTLLESPASFPEVAVIVSATAPLPRALAQDVERRFGAVLVEFFGSTETCVISTRRTARDDRWRPYPGLKLTPAESSTRVHAPWFAHDQLLQDVVAQDADGSFTVIGRQGDLVDVAGKRASLADLSRRLAALPGVQDAIVFQPPQADDTRVRRLAALVVAPGLTGAEISRRFRAEVDAVFVPRPLCVVPILPRNELGKLPLERLMRALTEASRHRRGR